MLLKRVYDDGLAQAGYLVACDATHHAVVIDPDRDVERYILAAKHEHVRIAFVTETHIHADFVSGARELARRTGATLLLSGEGGDDWAYRYAAADGARVVHNGDRFDVGRVRLEVRHTPGHTPEHISFLVTDRARSAEPIGMLTGDFIFVGDVGRPDLLERVTNAQGTMEEMARQLFRSIRATADLPDHLQIWPGHGAGSPCGKALGAMPATTLGYERLGNWAFLIDDEDTFVREVISGQPEAPRYFARMKEINRDGPPPRPTELIPEVGLAAVQQAMSAGTPVVDVRSSVDFAVGHIPKTLNLPTGSSLTRWAGSLLSYDQDIILLADDPDRVERAQHAMILIGLDRVVGWAGASVRDAWQAQVGPLARVEHIDVGRVAEHDHRLVVDVRSRAEWDAGHVPDAEHRFLGDLVDLTRELPRDTPIAVHCQGGTRSAIAASLLQAEGFTNVANLTGGFRAWEAAGLPVTRKR
jgi:hydroxyacylglutathione hydrolase